MLNDNVRPVPSTPYRAEPAAKWFAAQETNQITTEKASELAATKWSALIWFFQGWRMYFPLRQLSESTCRHPLWCLPLSPMDKFIHSIGKVTAFPWLNDNKGYWEISIEKRSRDKTAFTSRHGVAGLPDCSLGWKCYHKCLESNGCDTCLCDLEVCASLPCQQSILSMSVQQHINQIWGVLRLVYKAGITVKLNRCNFSAIKIAYLDHVIQTGCFYLAQHSTDAVAKLEHPCSQSGHRSF